MTKEEQLKLVKKFIYDDKVQETISSINSNLMEFNILEITGMGNQEIKHSNILGWLLDNSEHNLEHYILDNFLKEIILENRKDSNDNVILDKLQSYIYLSEKPKDITIYREQDNIDLLIVDEANKVVITIENKVYADERTELANCDGDMLGQLECYEKRVNAKYLSKDGYDKYFIFLTIDLEEASKGKEYWMKANHQMITNIIEDILKSKKDISVKARIMLESYVDLLKRNGIVSDKKLKELCAKIWEKESEALEIIMNNRPNKTSIIEKVLEDYDYELKTNAGAYNYFIRFDNSPLKFKIYYSTTKQKLGYSIVIHKSDNSDILQKIPFEDLEIGLKKLYKKSILDKPQHGHISLTSWSGYVVDEDKITDTKIKSLLTEFEKEVISRHKDVF